MREKLVKIGAKVVKHARYVTFQLAEVLVSRSLTAQDDFGKMIDVLGEKPCLLSV